LILEADDLVTALLARGTKLKEEMIISAMEAPRTITDAPSAEQLSIQRYEELLHFSFVSWT
jgi:hypothetical protein